MDKDSAMRARSNNSRCLGRGSLVKLTCGLARHQGESTFQYAVTHPTSTTLASILIHQGEVHFMSS
jgi:hypothetical protein